MLCRFGHGCESKLDAKDELSTWVFDSRGDDLPLMAGDKAIAPMVEPVDGRACPLLACDIDRDLDDLLHGVLKESRQVRKMDEEQVQVADKSLVMHEHVVDTSMVMEPRAGRDHVVNVLPLDHHDHSVLEEFAPMDKLSNLQIQVPCLLDTGVDLCVDHVAPGAKFQIESCESLCAIEEANMGVVDMDRHSKEVGSSLQEVESIGETPLLVEKKGPSCDAPTYSLVGVDVTYEVSHEDATSNLPWVDNVSCFDGLFASDDDAMDEGMHLCVDMVLVELYFAYG